MNKLEKEEREKLLDQQVKKSGKAIRGVATEFKKFIARGNVLDLAVAVVIGAAFSAIVNGLVNYIIMPCITALTGNNELAGLSTVLIPAQLDAEGNVVKAALLLQWGSFLQAIINFIIIAIVIFAFVKVVNGVKNALDFDERIKVVVQKKLDDDEELSKYEQKWLRRKLKYEPNEAPKKKQPAAPAAPVPPTPTEALLAEILEQLKANNNGKNVEIPLNGEFKK